MNSITRFEIPIVLVIFKRKDTVSRIIEVLERIQPTKIYILADAGRNPDEQCLVEECRKNVENSITWDCTIIKHYASENIGVYQNIGLGAKWVFEREETAIFLEDDSLPDLSFFDYCRELLEKYKEDEDVFWICGTNYLQNYLPKGGYSYMFTRHLLPCGWASWRQKFLRYYDGDFQLYTPQNVAVAKKTYNNIALFRQQMRSVESEIYTREAKGNPSSWDFQLILTIRANNLIGISPKYNLIRNIGVDEFSTHGGKSLSLVMTKRFCEIPTSSVDFPLKHPSKKEVDIEYEKRISKIILYPLSIRIEYFCKRHIGRAIRKIMKIDRQISIKDALKRRLIHKKN